MFEKDWTGRTGRDGLDGTDWTGRDGPDGTDRTGRELLVFFWNCYTQFRSLDMIQKPRHDFET